MCCLPREEGGLAILNSVTFSQVGKLRILWRSIANRSSVWARWVREVYLRKKSIWDVAPASNASWVWKCILNCREIIKPLIRCEIGSGEDVSLWFDHWLPQGPLANNGNPQPWLTFGLDRDARVADLIEGNHWVCRGILNGQDLLRVVSQVAVSPNRPDKFYWTATNSPIFPTKMVYDLIRQRGSAGNWLNTTWFRMAVPRFSFITWLAIHNRLPTGDRLNSWGINIDPTCPLCCLEVESRDHLFFRCPYSNLIWREGLLRTCSWLEPAEWGTIVDWMGSAPMDFRHSVLRLFWTSAIYRIWMERNRRRFGLSHMPPQYLLQLISRDIAVRFQTFKKVRCSTLNCDVALNWNIPLVLNEATGFP